MSDTYYLIETEPWSEIQRSHEKQLVDQLAYFQEHSDYYRTQFEEWDIDPMVVTSLERSERFCSRRTTYFGLIETDREHWNEVIQRCFYAVGIRPEDTVIFGVGQRWSLAARRTSRQ